MPRKKTFSSKKMLETDRKHTQHILWEQLLVESERINKFLLRKNTSDVQMEHIRQKMLLYRSVIKSQGIVCPDETVQMKSFKQFYNIFVKNRKNSVSDMGEANIRLAINTLVIRAKRMTIKSSNSY